MVQRGAINERSCEVSVVKGQVVEGAVTGMARVNECAAPERGVGGVEDGAAMRYPDDAIECILGRVRRCWGKCDKESVEDDNDGVRGGYGYEGICLDLVP